MNTINLSQNHRRSYKPQSKKSSPVNSPSGAIYLRCAAKDSDNLAIQLHETRKWAQADNVTILKTYTENGVSGLTKRRPALGRLLKDASKGQFQILYVYTWDQLGRDIYIRYWVFKQLEANHVMIRSADYDANMDFLLEFQPNFLKEIFESLRFPDDSKK